MTVTSLSAAAVPVADLEVGDRVALVGLTYFTVKWVQAAPDGRWWVAGPRSDGELHAATLAADATASRVFRLEVGGELVR